MFEAREEIIIALILITFLMVILVLIVILAIVFYRIRRSKYLQETSNLKIQFNEQLLQSQIEIQEQTLQNIAQEIHDNIGQTLSLVKLNLNTLDPNRPNWEEKTRTSKELVGKVIQDLRNLSKTLHSDSILSAGLFKAIEYELSLVQASGALHASLQLSGSPERPEPQQELILFRIVQEALNNIIKHAKANLISVKIWSDEKGLHLLIADDGTGFETADQNGEMDGGSGLRNMNNRARLIGGDCHIRSAPNKGTQIELNIPYKPVT